MNWSDRKEAVRRLVALAVITLLCIAFCLLLAWGCWLIKSDKPSCCETNAHAITALSDRLDSIEVTRDERETVLMKLVEALSVQVASDRTAIKGVVKGFDAQIKQIKRGGCK